MPDAFASSVAGREPPSWRKWLPFWGPLAVAGSAYLVLPGYLFWILLGLLILVVVSMVRLEWVYYLLVCSLIVENVYAYYRAENCLIKVFPFSLFCLCAGLGYFAARLARRVPARPTTPLDGILLIMICYHAVSVLWSPNRELGVYLTCNVFMNYLLFFLASAVIRTRDQLRRLMYTWVFSALVVGVCIVLSQWYSETWSLVITKEFGLYAGFTRSANRPSGILFVNSAAGICGAGVLLIMGGIGRMRWPVRLLNSVFLLFLIYCLILTNSRGGVVGWLGGAVFYVLLSPQFKRWQIRFGIIAMLITVIIVLVARPGFIDRLLVGFGYRGQLFFSEAATSAATISQSGITGVDDRLLWWTTAAEKMMEHPLTFLVGLGAGGFFNYIQELEHSVYLAFFFDFGVIGCVFFLIILYLLVRRYDVLFRAQKDSMTLLPALATLSVLVAVVGVQGTINYDLINRLAWFPLSLALCALSIEEREAAGKAATLPVSTGRTVRP